MDREQQRQNRRNTVSGFSCTAGAELTPLQSPTGRPAVDCDPALAAPVPFTTVIPPACPPPLPVPLNLPPGLIVASDQTTAYCPSTAGYSVTGTTAASVTAGAQQQIVLFTAIENITENQLNYLYEVVPSASASIISASLSGSTNSVISLTHLNYAQSEELIITIQDAKFTVNTLAVEQARNLLICQVESNLQSAICETSAYFGPSAAIPTNLPYVPSATSSTGAFLVTFGLLPSTGGQTAFALLNIPSLTAAAAQANSLALAQAQSSLRCVFGNAATAAACCSAAAPTNNLGFTYCVPATGPSIPGSATAVGYFSVAANTVFSVVSLAEANSVARALSRNSLNCYFPSTGTTATCTSLGLTGAFAPASTTSSFLPPGSVILYGIEDSVTAANAQALTIAQASLNCFWSNAGVTAFCPASPGFTAINNQYYILDASPTLSINYSSFVAADTVISYTSLDEANQQALQLAAANVSCLYCNDVVPPTCSGGVNATVGATGDLICNVLAEVAQNTAVSVGNILVSTSSGGINCCYGNEAVVNTNKCTSGAFFNGSTNATFTSADVFSLAANIITICESEPLPPTPTLLYPYSNLYATNNAALGCCSGGLPCGGTGFVTALPTLWAVETDLFNGIAAGATFYTSSNGSSAYAFPAGASALVPIVNPNGYRSITGGTGFTIGFSSCPSCTAGLTGYAFRGATVSNYVSDNAANKDIFCGGPTAGSFTLYTTSGIPFGPSAAFNSSWFLDNCGQTPFTPVTSPGNENHFYAGYISGATGYMIIFNNVGSNSSLNANVTTYSLASCPIFTYPYSVHVGASACSTGATATTLYGVLPSPQLFTSSTASTTFRTEFFNDASVYSYPSGTGYINFAHNSTLYYRRINGSTAQPPAICQPPATLYPVTVQWTTTGPTAICNFPNYFSSGTTGVFNENIRTVWSTLENSFTGSNTAAFYSSNNSFVDNIFAPSGSATYYLSKFTPGDTYRNVYREYTSSNYISTLKSYTGAFKASPFVHGQSLWAHSSSGNFMNSANPVYPNTKFVLAGTGGCQGAPLYSDIKVAIPLSSSYINGSFKTLPIVPISDDIYSNSLLFDGLGYKLSSTAQGSSGSNTITLNDLSRVGAGFTGAIVRCPDVTRIGNYQIPAQGTAIPTYISSIDKTSGLITLGGYYNKVSSTFNNESLYVTGFKIEAGTWSGSQFTCYGDNCNKLEVGHSLFSYYVGASGMSASIGYVTRINGDTIYYAGAPSYNNFDSYDIGTGASHGSGHVYIQGRQVVRLWTDDNKTQPFTYNLESNDFNFVWSQTGGQYTNQTVDYTVSKNLILGNTAGATAEFLVAGVNYTDAVPPARPFTTDYALQWDPVLLNYYTRQIVYQCDGSISDNVTVVPHTKHVYVNNCCDTVTSINGDTASACDYYQTYGALEIDTGATGVVGTLDLVSGYGYYDGVGHTQLINALRFVEGTVGVVNGFAYTLFDNGATSGAYPCNASYPYVAAGSAWMRQYLGYYDGEDPYAPAPIDPSLPGDYIPGGRDVNDPSYWASSPNPSLTQGYVFKEYVPISGGGCNATNFIHTEYSKTSGYRYSIWPTVLEAYTTVNQQNQMVGPSSPELRILFNASTASCGGYPGYFSTAASALSFEPDTEDAEVIKFNPSNYDIFSPFNFSSMPSVGSTATDLKEEATRVAQILVNSFVRCFYLNASQTGAACPTGFYTVVTGTIADGEYVSNISKVDANQRAKDIANSRNICIPPDIVGGGAGCDQTKIKPASATASGGSSNPEDYVVGVNLKYERNQCEFTPTMNVTTSLTFDKLTLTKMKICSVTGASKEIYVMSLDSDYPNQNIKIPIRFSSDPP